MAPDDSDATPTIPTIPTLVVSLLLQGTSSGSFWQLHEVGMPAVLLQLSSRVFLQKPMCVCVCRGNVCLVELCIFPTKRTTMKNPMGKIPDFPEFFHKQLPNHERWQLAVGTGPLEG